MSCRFAPPDDGAPCHPTPAFELNPETSAVTVESGGDLVSLRAGGLTAEATVAGPWGLAFRSEDRELASAGPTAPGLHAGGRRPEHTGNVAHDAAPHVAGGDQRLRPRRALRRRSSRTASRSTPGTRTAAPPASRPTRRARSSSPTPASASSSTPRAGLVRGGLGGRSGRPVLGAGRELEYFVIHGPTPREIVEQYAALTGRPRSRPRWSFGLWLSTSFTTDYDEETVTHSSTAWPSASIPLSVFHFDCFWMKRVPLVRLRVGPRRLPRPRGDAAAAAATRACVVSVWINPYIGQRSPLFEEAARGRLPAAPAGRLGVAVGPVAGRAWAWSTSPTRRARDWFAGKLRALLDSGRRLPSRPTSGSGSPSTWSGTTAPTRP